jgi:hypothetical protein
MTERHDGRTDERVEEETAALLADRDALCDLDAARAEIARGEGVRGVEAVRALRPPGDPAVSPRGEPE